MTLIQQWLADNDTEVPREIPMIDVLERYVLTEVQAGRASVDDGLEVLEVSL